MRITPLSVLFAGTRCAKSIQHQTSISRVQDSIQPISSPTRSTQGNTNKGSEQDFYNHNVNIDLTASVHSGLERPKRSTRTAQRLVRGVALVIGITLFLPVEQVSNAQLMPFKSAKHYAKTQMDSKQYSCLKKLWGKESAWNHLADNPHSTAYGIPQILGMKEKNPLKQVDLGIRYIRHRYDTPCKAWAFHKKHKWY